MSRGYSRAGGGLSIILAIIGTLIVVVVGIFLYSKFSGSSVFGGAATPTPTLFLTPAPTGTPAPTLVPIIQTTPTPTPEPSASTDLLGGTATPAPTVATVTAAPNFETVSVAVASLKVRATASYTGTDLGSVKYGQTYEVFAEDGKWVQIRFNNTYGWIYTGTDKDGDRCAVRGNTPIPAMPVPDPEPSFLKSASVSGNTLTVKFSCGVYGNKEHTSSLPASAFSVKEGGASISFSVTHTAGSDTATLALGTTSGGAVTVSIGSNTVYNSVGTASPAGSASTSGGSSDNSPPTFTASQSGTSIIVTFSEGVYASTGASGTLDSGDFSIVPSSAGTVVGTVTHSAAGDKTVTIALTSKNAGDVVTVTVKGNSAYDAAGNAASQGSVNVTLT